MNPALRLKHYIIQCCKSPEFVPFKSGTSSGEESNIFRERVIAIWGASHRFVQRLPCVSKLDGWWTRARDLNRWNPIEYMPRTCHNDLGSYSTESVSVRFIQRQPRNVTIRRIDWIGHDLPPTPHILLAQNRCPTSPVITFTDPGVVMKTDWNMEGQMGDNEKRLIAGLPRRKRTRWDED